VCSECSSKEALALLEVLDRIISPKRTDNWTKEDHSDVSAAITALIEVLFVDVSKEKYR